MIDRLNIGGLIYTVRLVRDLYDVDEGKHQPLMGDIRYQPCLIQISDQSDPQMQAVTLLHEALHGCLNSSGMPEHEESLVELLGWVLFRLLKDNPTLQADLLTWAGVRHPDRYAVPDSTVSWMETTLAAALTGDYATLREATQAVLDELRAREGAGAPEEETDGTS